MPELPEVETVRRGLAPAMEGRRIREAQVRRADLRFPFPPLMAERLTGARIERLGRRAKYLVAELDTAEALIMHLGMTGRFTVGGRATAEFHHDPGGGDRHAHVVLTLDDAVSVVFSDPRRFGFFDMTPLAALARYPAFAAMGPEPLDAAFSGAYLATRLAGRRAPVKAALLDQSVVAGLGNIYVCEALFRSRISPMRAAGEISRRRFDALAQSVREVITEAIAAGGSSISDFAHADGALGYFQHAFRVYDREGAPCDQCGASIVRTVQSGRSTFHCRTCQR